jgi:glycosyltransferase involved in cell wall biosynthesis
MNPPQPARVMKVSPTFLCGGTEGQFTALARTIDAQRFEVHCACLRRQGDLDAGLHDRGIPLREYPITSFFNPGCAMQQARFASDMATGGIDVVHAYSFYGNVFAIPPARLARVPVIIASIRDCGPYLSTWQQRVQRGVCRLADRVLVNATAVKRWLVDTGYDARRIVVIRNGVDVHRFTPRPNAGDVRGALGVPPGAPVVGVVSRLVPLKGLERFLEAAAIVSSSFPDARFVIVGEPAPNGTAYAARLHALARGHGLADRVIFAGRRDDIPEVLGAFTVAVMPSLSEGLSNVLLEALAARVPVVATTVGGTEEVVTNGVNGLLVPPDDAGAIAAAVRALLGHAELAARLADAGRALVTRDFSLERMARATEQLYSDLLAAKRGGELRRTA